MIPAAEHGSLLALRDARSAPRVAVMDLQTLTFVGALAQRADGGFSEFGRRFDDGDIGPLATTSATGALAASAATLSALHGKVFVLGRQSSHGAARLHVYDIAARTWTETPLTGAHLPEDPVALTYLATEDALFALGRKKGPGAGAYHLFRIGLRGAVQRLAIGGGGALKSEPLLTPTEDGALLLSASRQGARYRIAKLVVAGKVAHSAGRLEASGTLAAAPFLTRRAVTIGLGADDDPLEVIELPTTALAPSKAGSHGGNDGVLWPVR